MPKLGIMIEIPANMLALGLTVGDLVAVLNGITGTVGQGTFQGDFVHDATGCRIQIRNEGFELGGTRKW